MVGNFHFPSGKVLFGAAVDDDEPQNCDVKYNGEQCMGSQSEMLCFPSSIR